MKSDSESPDAKLNGELDSLLATLRAQVPTAEAVERMIYVGEATLAWEVTAEALSEGRATIKRELYDQLQELGRSLEADLACLDGVVVDDQNVGP